MSDMMKQFVGQEMSAQIKDKYPHMQYPSCLYARAVHVKEISGLYECTLKILDKNKQPDSRFPEVPKIVTDIPVNRDDVVVVILLYGECSPYIIGRCC